MSRGLSCESPELNDATCVCCIRHRRARLFQGSRNHASGDARDRAGFPRCCDADLVNGQMIHDSTCVVPGCHADGVDLSVRVPLLDDAGLTDQIRNGGTSADGVMPAFSENLISDEDLVDLIAFLRQMYP
ncbi:c-type cytochrome [Nannocystaceae bacterium ST9]